MCIRIRARNWRRKRDMSKKILSILVNNHPGVTARISGLFLRRGYNITSFTGEETSSPEVSRITVAVDTEEENFEQIRQQVLKLYDIKKAVELKREASIIKELALVKIRYTDKLNGQLEEWKEQYEAVVIDSDSHVLTFQVCNTKEKIDEFYLKIKPYGIIETIRSGVIALSKGKKNIYED